MLSTITFVVAGLSTGHKIGLAVVGASFIIFALISSFLLPRLNANFPGRSLGWYVVLCIAFFVAMISAVIVFGREKPEAKAAAGKTTASTSTAATTTTSVNPGGVNIKGNPAAGKTVFESSGCVGCHTLKAANATGTVGPNLDQLKPAYARIVTQVENGGGPMPAFKGTLTATQIQDVAAFVYTSTH